MIFMDELDRDYRELTALKDEIGNPNNVLVVGSRMYASIAQRVFSGKVFSADNIHFSSKGNYDAVFLLGTSDLINGFPSLTIEGGYCITDGFKTAEALRANLGYSFLTSIGDLDNPEENLTFCRDVDFVFKRVKSGAELRVLRPKHHSFLVDEFRRRIDTDVRTASGDFESDFATWCHMTGKPAIMPLAKVPSKYVFQRK